MHKLTTAALFQMKIRNEKLVSGDKMCQCWNETLMTL